MAAARPAVANILDVLQLDFNSVAETNASDAPTVQQAASAMPEQQTTFDAAALLQSALQSALAGSDNIIVANSEELDREGQGPRRGSALLLQGFSEAAAAVAGAAAAAAAAGAMTSSTSAAAGAVVHATDGPPSSDALPPRSPISAPTAAAGVVERGAAVAERVRLSGGFGNTSVSLQELFQWLEGTLPFWGLLAAVFLYLHCGSLMLLAWLLLSVGKANSFVRSAALHGASQRQLALALAAVIANVVAVLVVGRGRQLGASILLRPPPLPIPVLRAVFTAAAADLTLRLTGAALKLALLLTLDASARRTCAAPAAYRRAAGRRQARLMALLENILAVHRALVPVPVWFCYLVHCTPSGVLASMLGGFYLTLKGWSLLTRTRALAAAARPLRRPWRPLPAAESREHTCPICLEACVRAVALECSRAHIFCADCISEAAERCAACPVCRASLRGGPPPAPPPDGVAGLLPQLF